MKKKQKKKKTIVIIVCSLLIVVSGFFLIDNILTLLHWNKDNSETEKIKKKVDTLINKKEKKINFNKLQNINPDVVGHIKVPNTKIDTVVVQTTNNDYYIRHDLYKNNNDAGTVFMDYENSLEPLSHNTILYGHARLDNTMFGSLHLTLEDKWYDKGNYSLEFITKGKKYKGEIFSVHKSEADDEYITTNFQSNEAFDAFIQRIKNRSIRDFNIEVNGNDHIITLSTCSSDNEELYRNVIHAKLVEISD